MPSSTLWRPRTGKFKCCADTRSAVACVRLHWVTSSHMVQGHEARLADMAEERARRRVEMVAREEAAQERRRALEEERRAKLRELDERRRDQVRAALFRVVQLWTVTSLTGG